MSPAVHAPPQNVVMVVDDSITVRKDRTVQRWSATVKVITAKDGVDGAQPQEELPDVMLLDIEMPRMDGYELASAHAQHRRAGRSLIIMITSRTGDKHRQLAMELGSGVILKTVSGGGVADNIYRYWLRRAHERKEEKTEICGCFAASRRQLLIPNMLMPEVIGYREPDEIPVERPTGCLARSWWRHFPVPVVSF